MTSVVVHIIPPPRSPSFSNLVCAPRKFVNIQGNSTFHKAKKRKQHNPIQNKILHNHKGLRNFCVEDLLDHW